MAAQGGGRYLIDAENAAVIRSHAHLQRLFKLAGLALVRTATQSGFPEDLHPVRRTPTIMTAPPRFARRSQPRSRHAFDVCFSGARPCVDVTTTVGLCQVRMYWLRPADGSGAPLAGAE